MIQSIVASPFGATAFSRPSEPMRGHAQPDNECANVRHSFIKVNGAEVFYREAGSSEKPVLLLLHGFANSSHYFRHLLPRVSKRFHTIAPDLPSFGFTRITDASYPFTFEQLTQSLDEFLTNLHIGRFAMYVFDYGAPIGFNLALRRPDRVTGIISQNGNVYDEGLSIEPWAPLRAYWRQPSNAIREEIKARMSFEGVQKTYFSGVPHPELIEPEAYWLDAALLQRPGMMDVQVDLKLDYKSNFARYSAYQQYLKASRPPLVAIWGRHDPFFLPAGAEAFRRDVPRASVHLLDTGHFALETHLDEIAQAALSLDVRTESE